MNFRNQLRTTSRSVISFLAFCLSISFLSCAFGVHAATVEKPDLLFVGTYTNGASLGIYLYRMDTATGALSLISTSPSGKAINPSYLTIHPNKKWIYAVSEQNPGSVNAFSFDSAHKSMSFLNTASSHGDGPCHVSVDNSGRYALVANYGSGSVAVLPIQAGGGLGSPASFDQHSGSPHAHMILQARNNLIYSTDLGLNKIFIYTLDTSTGTIRNVGIDASTQSGAGPRHLAFHPTRSWVYVLGELGGIVESYTISSQTGSLTRFQSISSLPQGSSGGASSADIHVSPDGKFLYASNRGSYNNIAMYSVDQSTGSLTLLGHQATKGNGPRNFVIDPTGTFLLVANRDGNSVVTFKINPATGMLIETGMQTTVPSPVCLKFLGKGDGSGTGIQNIISSSGRGFFQPKLRVSVSGSCSNVRITYRVQVPCLVQLGLYTMAGKKVVLMEQAGKNPGIHESGFDLKLIPNGVYMIRFQAGSYLESMPFWTIK